jgi:hypothetical protein
LRGSQYSVPTAKVPDSSRAQPPALVHRGRSDSEEVHAHIAHVSADAARTSPERTERSGATSHRRVGERSAPTPACGCPIHRFPRSRDGIGGRGKRGQPGARSVSIGPRDLFDGFSFFPSPRRRFPSSFVRLSGHLTVGRGGLGLFAPDF